MKHSSRFQAKTGQFPSTALPLLHAAVPLDPSFAVSSSGAFTHSPDTTVTFLHYHDSLELGYCYEGSGVFIVEDKILPFSAGCASVIPKQQIHIARSSAEHGSKWKFVNLDPALLLGRAFPEAAWLFDPGARSVRNIISSGDPSGLAEAIRSFIEESTNGEEADRLALKGLALFLLARLSQRKTADDAATGRQPGSGIGSISQAVDTIIRQYTEPLQIPDLAAECGMSEATFRRRFIRSMGVSPMDYIHTLRIQMASLQLLSSQARILDIALLSGYDSLTSFNRQFRKIQGMTPREYRGNGYPRRTAAE